VQSQQQGVVVTATVDSGQPDQRGEDDVGAIASAVLGPDGKQLGDGGESCQVRLGISPTGQDGVVVQPGGQRRPTTTIVGS
jgi:hypothetical protein